jgi:TetR/AcrR family transcriptional regulator, transcriptional repressor for nem operon
MPWEKQFDTGAILDKAMQAFWRRGYEATSMQDLVACTGVNRASLYATYGDKHALFLASLKAFAETVHHRRLAELEAAHGPRDAIRGSLLAFIPRKGDRTPARGCFLTNTALELAAHDPDAGRIVVAAQKRTEAWYARMIEKGKAVGEIAAHVDPAEAASALLACVIGLSVLSRSRPERGLLQAIVDDAVRRLS